MQMANAAAFSRSAEGRIGVDEAADAAADQVRGLAGQGRFDAAAGIGGRAGCRLDPQHTLGVPAPDDLEAGRGGFIGFDAGISVRR